MDQIQNLQKFVADGVKAVEFKLVRCKDDLNNENLKFEPLMSHQIFGETETIFGYTDLKVKIFYVAGPLHMHISTEYESKANDLMAEIEVDDIISTISEKLPAGCEFVSRDIFLKLIEKAEHFKPFGEKLFDHNFGGRYFEIYYCNYETPRFIEYFWRMQTFILWFVDAASYIETEDPRWDFFICYERYRDVDGKEMYASVGYSTVYQYYAYPQNVRPRISQMLVLPPFQKFHIGTQFLETIYQFYMKQSVIDITVEDPSDEFQQLRNFVDVKLCLNLPAFSKEKIKCGFDKSMVVDARGKLKINPKQCRKVYEIIRLYHTDIHNIEDYKAYQREVKKRLNASYERQIENISKLEKAQKETQWLKSGLPSKAEQIEQLQNEYEQIESCYLKTINKLKALES